MIHAIKIAIFILHSFQHVYSFGSFEDPFLIDTGPHVLCWISGVVPFNTWLISTWEENNCFYKLSNWQNDNHFHSKWQLRPFWVKYIPRCHFVHLLSLLTTFLFFSAWDKSRVKWDNSRNSTQKMRTTVRSNRPERRSMQKLPSLDYYCSHNTQVQKYEQGQNRSPIFWYVVLII